MASGQDDSTKSRQSCIMLLDTTLSLYDRTSSESSASTPIYYNTGFDDICDTNNFMPYPAFPMKDPTYHAPIDIMPVKVDIEKIYEDYDQRHGNDGPERTAASYKQSRRRAQNRASQRAFRDRKEKHIQDLESELKELKGQHTDLTKSYEALQVEYSGVKQDLEKLEKLHNGNMSVEEGWSIRNSREWEKSFREMLDPRLFDMSVFF